MLCDVIKHGAVFGNDVFISIEPYVECVAVVWIISESVSRVVSEFVTSLAASAREARRAISAIIRSTRSSSTCCRRVTKSNAASSVHCSCAPGNARRVLLSIMTFRYCRTSLLSSLIQTTSCCVIVRLLNFLAEIENVYKRRFTDESKMVERLQAQMLSENHP